MEQGCPKRSVASAHCGTSPIAGPNFEKRSVCLVHAQLCYCFVLPDGILFRTTNHVSCLFKTKKFAPVSFLLLSQTMDDNSGSSYSSFPLHSKLPIGSPLSPYLSVDPNIFKSEPQYILPEGASARRGRFELAFSQIGGCVMTGAALGGTSGLYSSLKDREVMENAWAIRRTQMLNYIVKRGQSSATAFGSVAVLYSGFGVLLNYARGADDELNTIAAATLTGLLYKSPAGLKKCLVGGGTGFALSVMYCLYSSGDRIKQMLGFRLSDIHKAASKRDMHKRMLQVAEEQIKYQRKGVKYGKTSEEAAEGLCTIGEVLKRRWKVLEKIGSGGFGEVYEAVDLADRTRVALKVEQKGLESSALDVELSVYSVFAGSKHCPSFYDYGSTDTAVFIVIQLLGPSLSQWRRCMPKKRFTVGTSIRCAHQILSALEELHEAGYIHRDIKLSNIAPGLIPESQIGLFLFDFGLCRKYIHDNGVHKEERMNVGFRGTSRYASINAHDGKDLSRRDDMLSLFYVTIEMCTGKLPWCKMKGRNEIVALKKSISVKELCKGLPDELLLFYDHISELKFKDKPYYDRLKQYLDNVLLRENVKMDDPFDWQKDEFLTSDEAKRMTNYCITYFG
uniref:Protein kinase domain-containing protein n=1 Tax=Trichuris muris TaxID=70415 RepID=A0A5S6QHU8_TRIMR